MYVDFNDQNLNASTNTLWTDWFTTMSRNACLAFCAFFLMSDFVPADQSNMDQGIERLAGAVKEFFQREGRDMVASVSSVVGVEGDGNAFLRQKLMDALKQQGFELRRSDLVISGRFFKHFGPAPQIVGNEIVNDGPEQVALKLKAVIRHRRSDEIQQQISIPIFGEEVVQHLAPTSETPAGETETERQHRLNRDLDSPRVAIDGNKVRAVAHSDFAVEIHIRKGKSNRTVSRRPVNDHGLAFIELKKGEEYIVRLHNAASFEAAVKLTIDGLSMYAFSQQGQPSAVLVPPRSHVDIPGWYINDRNSDQFEIMSYARSAAATKRVPKSNVGTITAAFFAAWDPADNPPDDELNPKSADSATGQGRRIEQRYETVRRVIGKRRAIVTLRYNR